MMDGARLKAALSAGERVCGTMFMSGKLPGEGDSQLGNLGLDYVIIDNEHSPYTRSDTARWARRLTELGITPVVRIPIPAPHYVTMALDLGAQGILAPYVETIEQVQAVAGAAKYLPLKGEAVGRVVHQREFPSEETRQYLTERNKNNFLIIGIESVAAIERLDTLFGVDEVDAAFVGPNDLTIQLGIPGQYHHPDYLGAVDTILEGCRAHKIPLMIHFFNYEMAEPWINKGVNFVLFGTDRNGIGEQMQKDITHLRALPLVP